MEGADSLNYFTLIILLEMLSVNTYTTYLCSQKKMSAIKTIISMTVITLIFSGLFFLLFLKLPIQLDFNGKGIFFLCGFFYALPLKYLFDQSLKDTIIIMSSSWIYTVFVFSFSVQVGYLFPFRWLGLSVTIVQTLFYLISLPYYLKFVTKTFIYILNNIETRMKNSLLLISLSWFFTIFLVNYIFIEGSSHQLKFIMLLIIILNAILSYQMVYKLVFTQHKAETLSQITKIDALTQLKNREGLYEDAQNEIANETPFSLIFLDLDDFKSINDLYGHAAGDAYLIAFARSVSEYLKPNEGLYRLHGDEFVILSKSLEIEPFCRQLEKFNFATTLEGLDFKGLSFGYATFPADARKLSDLLHLADLKMYETKNRKRNRTSS